MSTQTAHSHSSHTGQRDRVRKVLLPAGIASAAVAIGFTAVGVFYQGPPDQGPADQHAHSPWEFYGVAVGVVLATVLVFGIVLPRALLKQSAGGTALTLSLIATVVLVPAFWSGLPIVLGVGGALLGYAGRHAPAGAGKSMAAVALGLLAAAGYVAICIWDTVDRAGIL